MQRLIVHHDVEMGEGLHAMLRAYSTDKVEYVGSDAAAHALGGESSGVRRASHPARGRA